MTEIDEAGTKKELSAGIKAALARQKELREAGLLVRRTPAEKARDNPSSLRMAINAKCWDCEGGDSDPSVQWRIGNCVITECALNSVRPSQHLKGTPVPAGLRNFLAESDEGEGTGDEVVNAEG